MEAVNPYLHKIKSFFKKREFKEIDILWEIVNLLIYEKIRSSDVAHVYKLLDFDSFVRLVNLVNGRILKLPTREEIEESLITAFIYYDKKVHGLDWTAIKNKYAEFNLSSIKYALKIKSLDDFIKQKLDEYIKKLEKIDKEKKSNE